MAKSKRARRAAKSKKGLNATDIVDGVVESLQENFEEITDTLEDLQKRVGKLEDTGVKLEETDLDALGVESPEELEEILEDAAEEAVENLEDKNPVAAAVIEAGLNTGEVVEGVLKRRKSKKEDGEELQAATTEEVAELMQEVAEEIAEELDDDEIQALVDEGHLSQEDADEAMEEDAEPKGKKTASKSRAGRSKKSYKRDSRPRRKTANRPAVQRKYQGIYTPPKTNQQAAPKTVEQKQAMFGRMVKCAGVLGAGMNGIADPEKAAYAARTYYKDAELERYFKSMNMTQPSAGGLLVQMDYVNEIIPLLYSNTVVFELGAKKMNMPRGNMQIPKRTQGARAMFDGEARPMKASKPAVGMLSLSAKRITGKVLMTEELLMSTDYSSDQIFGDDLITQMQLGLEYGALLGNGTAFQPMGALKNPNIEEVNLLKINNPDIADNAGHPMSDLPIYVRGIVRSKNVIGDAWGWTFNSDAEQYFMRMKDNTGAYIWKEEMEKSGTFNGAPYRTTNMITTENGYTTALFGLWSDMIIADQAGIQTRTSYDATTLSDNGEINTFDTWQTVTRAGMWIDVGTRHDESFVRVTNINVLGATA